MLLDEVGCGIRHPQFFKRQRYAAVFSRSLGSVLDVGPLEGGKGLLILTESCLQHCDALEPLRLFVTQLIENIVSTNCVGKSKRPFFQLRAGDRQILPFRACGHGLRIGFDGSRIIFELRLEASENNRPAGIARRIRHGFRVVVGELCPQILLRSKTSCLGKNDVILREPIDDLDELIERLAEFTLPHKNRNQTPAHCRNTIGFLRLRDLRLLDLGDLRNVKLLKFRFSSSGSKSVTHQSDILTVDWIHAKKTLGRLSRVRVLLRFNRLPHRFDQIILLERCVRAFCSSCEHSNGARFIVTPVVIRRRPNDAADEGIRLVNGFEFTLGRGKIAPGLEEVCEFEPTAQLLLRIGFELDFAADHPFLDWTHGGFVGNSPDVGEDFARRRPIGCRQKQRLHVWLPFLRTKQAHPKFENLRIFRRGVHAPLRLIVHQHPVILTGGEAKKARLGRAALPAERAFYVFRNSLRTAVLRLKNGARLVCPQRGVLQSSPAALQPVERVGRAEIVPEECRRLKIALGFAGLDPRKPCPDAARRSHYFAVGIDLAKPGYPLPVPRLASCEVFCNRGRNSGVAGVVCAERPVQLGRTSCEHRIGRIGGRHSPHGRCSRFKM